MYAPGSVSLSSLLASPHSNPCSTGGTSAPNRASCSSCFSPFCADVPVLQQNTQARRQRTACASLPIVACYFFFLPFFSNGWASARRRCQRLDATNSPQDTLSQRHRRCWGSNKRDRLQIESCCLPGLLKDRRGRQRRIIAPFTSSAILAVLSKSRWTNKVMKES